MKSLGDAGVNNQYQASLPKNHYGAALMSANGSRTRIGNSHVQALLDERYFGGILNAVQTGILMIDAENHKIAYANPAALRIIGSSTEEVIGKVCHNFLCPAEVGKCPITDLGQSIDNSERVVINSHRERVPVLKTVVPAVLEDREYLIESCLDIRERKEIEQQFLSRRIAAIGETAAMVGHDLRNPLQAMTATLYLAKKLLRTGISQDRNEALGLLEKLDDQAHYMDKIVSDLQDYARPGMSDPVETDLSELISEAISSVNIPQTVQVSNMVQRNLSRTMADPDLLKRVFVNLILNAVQAMPQGGKLTVIGSEIPDFVVITVQDSGTGIPTEILEKIFEPFFTTKAQGQGLGLAVCKRLVEALEGTITVKSELGKGSTFTVNLRTNRTNGAS